MEEAVLAVKISPNNKFIAVALMDSTVKIFFLDTFKVRKLVLRIFSCVGMIAAICGHVPNVI